jgi:hypothetical protein
MVQVMLERVGEWLAGSGPTWDEVADSWQEQIYRRGEHVDDYILVVPYDCPLRKLFKPDGSHAQAFYVGPFGEMRVVYDKWCPSNRMYVIHPDFVRELYERLNG